ncbi:MAG: lipid-A-disaccharide synthase [Candidatus Methylumidiphilus alinenensis]|uniref:Lipid-A-disaccharide synthase n=1 Tax=Candidatus Methylumidiphilus alinenensis TaxID=2202197 RepID=A0A2W4QQM1_9GAMM|nr:MAG: lipid-A-disaccharide synthase [Candidatus Methylumidiphilus alinenensis]
MLSAGEASGDQHAASLFLELKKLMPEVKAIGMGGAKMREAGVEIRFDSTSIAVIGTVEVIKHYGEIRRALALMTSIAIEEHPDLLVCVDYKEFNFRLARSAKAAGVKVLFYVSPQVWAWRPGRVKKYGAVVDHMAVIFPFEVPFYEAHQIPVTYVGHPLAGKVVPSLSKNAALKEFGLESDGPVIGLLPGSRSNEIKRLLPVILATVELLSIRFPTASFVLNQASSVTDGMLEPYLANCKVMVKAIKGRNYDVLQCCDAVITVSGTATLEVALAGIPMAIIYKLTPITYWLGRLLISINFIGLPNILAGKGIVREFIQREANATNLAEEIGNILEDKNYANEIRDNLARVKELLGEGGGSSRLASLTKKMLLDL